MIQQIGRGQNGQDGLQAASPAAFGHSIAGQTDVAQHADKVENQLPDRPANLVAELRKNLEQTSIVRQPHHARHAQPQRSPRQQHRRSPAHPAFASSARNGGLAMPPRQPAATGCRIRGAAELRLTHHRCTAKQTAANRFQQRRFPTIDILIIRFRACARLAGEHRLSLRRLGVRRPTDRFAESRSDRGLRRP